MTLQLDSVSSQLRVASTTKAQRITALAVMGLKAADKMELCMRSSQPDHSRTTREWERIVIDRVCTKLRMPAATSIIYIFSQHMEFPHLSKISRNLILIREKERKIYYIYIYLTYRAFTFIKNF
jgi:hypothetical protein